MTNDAVEAFLARWQQADGGELANYQLFVGELCALLDLPPPQPSREDARDNAYVFERRVAFRHGDGSESAGRIDCYRRGAFVLEAKKLRSAGASAGYDAALLRARAQAEGYARALPAQEGRPPFLVVADVGRAIELYAEFSRSGATYTPFPDPRSHRIALTQLREATMRERLRAVWLDPLSLDPARLSGKVTREIAAHLAGLARSLEAGRHAPEAVAGFLTRCLFTLFAEDVGLLPPRAFTDLLAACRADPGQFVPLVAELWQSMDAGRFSVAVRAELLRFNGKLFKQPEVIALTRAQIDALIEASGADWTQVEPAIFGTLLERALDPLERHALGAHYTPRAYVERLVLPAVIEPLREDWANVQAAALVLADEGRIQEARTTVRAFHHRLCETRVLDPACGSGNFLYVAMEHMKRLEGEVLNQMEVFGASLSLETEGLAVDPHQFLGLEVNPRAAAITELVLWIGYLQWHFRTRGRTQPPIPVLRDFRNIECRDAVLAWERMEWATDARGVPVSRWDGRTTKKHPVTGEEVPDETARVPLERYLGARKADWPAADFVVGNPPFIGAGWLRSALGDGYAEALRAAWPDVPESSDLVMYWWHHAAQLTREGKLRRFGLITTNSLRQTFNRRVIERHLSPSPPAPLPRAGEGSLAPLSLAFAIADHPWVDSADGAAVRIAMSVGVAGEAPGRLLKVVDEQPGEEDAVAVRLAERSGHINADLTIGANVAGALPLRANADLSSPGVKLHGSGFIVTPEEAANLGLGTVPGLDRYIRPYRNGRDLTDRPRGVLVIDLFGLTAEEVRTQFPAVYQWLVYRVKPERDHNNRASYRDIWWVFGEPRKDLRSALVGLPRYIATVETAKHRTFQFLDCSITPDNKLVAIAVEDGYWLGVLSSSSHVTWALAAGSRLGVGNDPVYVKSRCLEAFPFPAATPDQQSRIRALAEQLDAHRKRVLAPRPLAGEGSGVRAALTLTGLYNVLEKLKSGEPLSAKEKAIHEQGLVSVLKSLHDELDREVLAAYGWSDLAPLLEVVNGNARPSPPSPRAGEGCEPPAPSHGDAGVVTTRDEAIRRLDEALLERLVALNAVRAAEEARGLARWLRPQFQQPAAAPSQAPLETEAASQSAAPAAGARPAAKEPWPATLPEQVAAVARVLAQAGGPASVDALSACFSGRGAWKKRLPQLLDTLVALGRARQVDGGRFAAVE